VTWTESIYDSGYFPFNNKGDKTIAHTSWEKKHLHAGHNQGRLPNSNVGKSWNKHNGQIKVKKVGNELKFIFESEDSDSTIVVNDDEYNLNAEDLRPLISMYWKGTKILIKDIE